MTIDLKNREENTMENFRLLIASKDDSQNTQFRVTEEGILFLSEDVGTDNLEKILSLVGNRNKFYDHLVCFPS